MKSVDDLDVALTCSQLPSLEKLKLAARLVQEVAYAQAGFQSEKMVAHLMLIAANLDRLSETPSDFVDANSLLSIVKS